MSTESETEQVQEEIQYESIAEFLEGIPPNRVTHISDLSEVMVTQYLIVDYLAILDTLHN